MNKKIRALSLLLTLAMLIGALIQTAGAASIEEKYRFTEQTLPEIIAQFMEEYGLTEENFSLSYRALDSGETFHFEEHTYRTAGSMYKLALNMYYYDLERSGEIDPEMTIGDWTLPEMHRETILNSNNEMAIAMLYNLGTFYEYRQKMMKYSDQTYSYEYYWNNVINSSYMLDVLSYLYEHQGDYEELMQNLKKANPWLYFKQYVNAPIAHKYGMFQGAYCDAGIVFAESPFLLVAMLQLPYEEETEQTDEATEIEEEEPAVRIVPDEVLGRTCQLMEAYTAFRAAGRAARPRLPRKFPAEETKKFRAVCYQ